MAILDIKGRSVINATRMRGHKGQGQPKGRPMLRDNTTLGHSRREGHGGFLDFWLLPLEASGYDYEATERATGIDARHMRRVVEVMGRMEVEAEETCTESRKQAVRETVSASVKARGLRPVSQAEIAMVYEGTVIRKLPSRRVAQEMGISMARLQTVRSLARSRGQWPSGRKGVAS